jgi:hypothetical protein
LGKLLEIKEDIRIDAVYGFRRLADSKERIGFLLNMHAVNKIKLEEKSITYCVVILGKFIYHNIFNRLK